MSSPFLSFGGGPNSICQHCRSLLPPNIVQCGYCGYDNSPVQGSDFAGHMLSSSNSSWNADSPQNNTIPSQYNDTSSFQSDNTPPNQYSNPQWGPRSFSPQQFPFSPFSQPSKATQSGSQANSLRQWYQKPSDNSLSSTELRGNTGQLGLSGQLPSSGINQDAALPSAFYNAFPGHGQVNGSLPEFISPPQTPEISHPVKVERRTLNMKKVAALVAIFLVLIGGSIAGYGWLNLQLQASKTNKPAGYPIPKGPPLFTGKFTDNSQQWDTQSVAGKYLVSLSKGNLVLEDDDNKLFPILLPGGQRFDNFKLIVNAKLSQGDRQNGYGICIRGTTDSHGNLTSYYRIELYGNGAYTIFKVATDSNQNTSSTTLVGTTVHAAIQPVGHINQVVIIANGPKMSLIVNGQTVRTFSDISYASGVMGLFVSNVPNAHPKAQAVFSQLAIYPVNAK